MGERQVVPGNALHLRAMVGRSGHTATLLLDGTVLVVGGADASTEIYDPNGGT